MVPSYPIKTDGSFLSNLVQNWNKRINVGVLRANAIKYIELLKYKWSKVYTNALNYWIKFNCIVQHFTYTLYWHPSIT